jgi:Uma2 family endonuclease
MAVQERTYTAEEFMKVVHLPEYRDKRLELIEGKLLVMPLASTFHGVVAAEVNGLIWDHLQTFPKRPGYGFANVGYTLHRAPDTVRALDFGFIARDRLSELSDDFVELAPDFGVEVVSWTDTAEQISDKVRDFLRCGTPLLWVVYPRGRYIVVHTPEGARTFEKEDTLDGGDVLPGFSVSVQDIFAVLDF